MKNKRILITGASGYIGKHLIKLLPEYFNSCRIYCIDKKLPTEKLNNFFRCDLTNTQRLKKLLKKIKPDVIFHLAGSGISIKHTWREFFDINYKTTETLLTVIRTIPSFNPRIIIMGSAAEYGRVPSDKMPITEETPLNPVSPYGCVKALQSVLAKYCANTGMDIIIIRPFNIIGQNMSENLAIGNFQKQIKEIIEKKKPPRIYVGNINVKRDYLNLTDALRAFCLIAKKGKSGEVYNVSSGKAISLKYILNQLCSKYRIKAKIIVDKKLLRKNDVTISYGSNKKLKLHTGWSPYFTFKETLDNIL